MPREPMTGKSGRNNPQGRSRQNARAWNDRFLKILKRDYRDLDPVVASLLENPRVAQTCAMLIRAYVDKGVTVGDLKGTVEFVFKELLGDDVKLRFRPHYFSYTEPSFEIDFTSPMVRKMGKEWLELAGCGMVHPQVFETVGYDPEIWTGWAFGFGIERIAMLRYEINDIRLFYENDTRFLKQF